MQSIQKMGLSVGFCCLACTCGCADWGHLSGICCQRAREKFEAGNAFVSGDWRSSRWCTVEVSSHRLGSKSVMSVREKCDEKSWEERTQVSVQRTDANPGAPGRFVLPDLLLSTPIRSRRFRFLVKHSGESCSTSTLPVLSLARVSPDCDGGSVALR